MKSFFKKLSLVLVLAMVVTLIPANMTKAADVKPVTIYTGASVADGAITAKELEVGDVLDNLKFKGESGYFTGTKVVTWASSDETVATVVLKEGSTYLGTVTALAAGKTTISVATDKGYEGSFELTVKAAAAPTTPVEEEPEVEEPVEDEVVYEQVAYNEITLTYPTAEEATAAAKAMTVKLVRKVGKTTRTQKLSGTATATENVVSFKATFSNGKIYQITAPGVDCEQTIAWGAPDSVVLEYDTPLYDKTNKDITGASINNKGEYSLAVPTAVIYDENGVVVGTIGNTAAAGATPAINATMAAGLSLTEKVFSLYGTKQKTVTLQSNGTVKCKDAGVTINVKLAIKGKLEDGRTEFKLTSDAADASAVAYVAPQIEAAIYDVVLTDKAAGKDIKWHTDAQLETEDFVSKYSMKATESAKVAFYLVGDDEKRYTGSGLVAANSTTTGVKCLELKSGDRNYNFKFVLDPDSDQCISVNATSGAVKAYAKGTAKVYVLMSRTLTTGSMTLANSDVIGEIVIEVADKAVASTIELLGSEYVGYTNSGIAKYNSLEIEYRVLDQNGDPINGTVAAGEVTGAKDGVKLAYTATAFSVAADGTETNGKIKFDLTGRSTYATPEDKEEKLTVTLSTDSKVKAEAEFVVVKLDPTNEDLDQAVEYRVDVVGKADLTNKNIQNKAADNLGFDISVVETVAGVPFAKLAFVLTSKSDLDTNAKLKAAFGTSDCYVVMIKDDDDKNLAGDADDAEEFAAANKSVAAGGSYRFDAFKTSSYVAEFAKNCVDDGEYTVALYKYEYVAAVGEEEEEINFDEVMTTQFEVTSSLNSIAKVTTDSASTTYGNATMAAADVAALVIADFKYDYNESNDATKAVKKNQSLTAIEGTVVPGSIDVIVGEGNNIFIVGYKVSVPVANTTLNADTASVVFEQYIPVGREYKVAGVAAN